MKVKIIYKDGKYNKKIDGDLIKTEDLTYEIRDEKGKTKIIGKAALISLEEL